MTLCLLVLIAGASFHAPVAHPVVTVNGTPVDQLLRVARTMVGTPPLHAQIQESAAQARLRHVPAQLACPQIVNVYQQLGYKFSARRLVWCFHSAGLYELTFDGYGSLQCLDLANC